MWLHASTTSRLVSPTCPLTTSRRLTISLWWPTSLRMALLSLSIASINSSVPFLHFYDGFRTSHEVASMEEIPQDKVKSIYPFEKALAFKNNALNPTHPSHTGLAMGGDMFFQTVQAAQPFYDAVPQHVQDAMDAVASICGRQYHLYDYVGAKDADKVIVTMGSGAQTVEETVNYLNKQGEKVGVIKVHLFRPFSAKHFNEALPASCKKVCVLDRIKEDGAVGEPLYLDVCCGLNDLERKVKVIGGQFGLGGKDFTPNMVKAVFDNLKVCLCLLVFDACRRLSPRTSSPWVSTMMFPTLLSLLVPRSTPFLPLPSSASSTVLVLMVLLVPLRKLSSLLSRTLISTLRATLFLMPTSLVVSLFLT